MKYIQINQIWVLKLIILTNIGLKRVWSNKQTKDGLATYLPPLSSSSSSPFSSSFYIRKLSLYIGHKPDFFPQCRVDTTFYRAGVYGLLADDRLWITHEFVMLPDHVNVGGNYEPTVHGSVPTPDDSHL